MGEELKASYQRISELECALRLARSELDECWFDFIAAGKHSRVETVESRISVIDMALDAMVL